MRIRKKSGQKRDTLKCGYGILKEEYIIIVCVCVACMCVYELAIENRLPGCAASAFTYRASSLTL